MFRIGKPKKENLIDRDACILASRAKANPANHGNYIEMLKFIEGSQNGKAVVMFLKAYPDAYREDDLAKDVIDRYVVHNGGSAYGIHAEALSLYSLFKEDFSIKYNMDMLSMIKLKNINQALLTKESEISKIYSKKSGKESELISAQKRKEAGDSYIKYSNCKIALGNGGYELENLLRSASEAYEELAEKYDGESATIAKAQSVLINQSIGLGSSVEPNIMSNKLNKIECKNPTFENQYNAFAFETESGLSELLKFRVRDYFGTMARGENISNEGLESIELGANLISSQSDFLSE